MTPLSKYSRDITSHHGEDGMIAKVFENLGTETGYCAQFASWDGEYNSHVWSLWHDHGWHALLIDGRKIRAEQMIEHTKSAADRVRTVHAYVTSSGPNAFDSLFADASFPQDFDLLSLDAINGDDHLIWNAMREFSPKLVVIRYNNSFPAWFEFTQREPDKQVGSSALSLCNLARDKGYSLIGATAASLFFLKDELVEQSGFPRVEISDCVDAKLQPVVYSDFVGVHHLTKVGYWGFTGINAHRSRLQGTYRRIGKATYRKFSWIPIVSKLAHKLERPGDATPED